MAGVWEWIPFPVLREAVDDMDTVVNHLRLGRDEVGDIQKAKILI